MKMTIGSFVKLVGSDYGEAVASEVARRISAPSGVVEFRQAMDVLDQVLRGERAPLVPRHAATSSFPQEVFLEFAD